MATSDSNPPIDSPPNPEGASDSHSTQWLDAVLHETLSGSDEPSNQGLMKALIDIRKRRMDEPFDLAPAGEEMVCAVLNARFGEKPWGSMSGSIMESLGNDPLCRQRLESLWDRLAAAAREE